MIPFASDGSDRLTIILIATPNISSLNMKHILNVHLDTLTNSKYLTIG
ncbi:hypothetical protein VCRA2114E121_40245 [Vibrio crassostreae]|nr:hypothetical protein VCRA2113O196_30100 [Vibrio crassostreae]CAK2482446.1 hypothetical protein VCRA2113O210_20244 [Vibrio crassostreae]CAK2511042.1 hypothetical protein VCRA2114E121_40245 [Vibrio crassostreae]CAK3014044.1 hypothetical protein VCRA217O111_40244 [Vibrio crassostreae]